MRYKFKEVVKLFWEKEYKNSNISLEEISSLCHAPFKFFVKVITCGHLQRFKITHFGRFIVFKTKHKKLIKKLNITEESIVNARVHFPVKRKR